MSYETLLVEKEAGVATITFNRPDRLNALTLKMIDEIPQALEEVSEDDAVKAVIITGSGRAFCAGAEMDSPLFKGMGTAGYKKVFDTVARTVMLIRNMKKPVIAAVNGACVAAGFNMVLACDIIIAAENARFGQTFSILALHPDYGGTYFFPRLVGPHKALELMWTGRVFDVKEADRLGLVNQIVPPDKLLPTAREMAQKLAQGPSMAIAITKMAVYRALESDLPTALEMEGRSQTMLFLAEDMKEGLRAFLEKGKPNFKGK